MTDRKKPGVARWAAVAVVVMLAGYPLSLGPVAWLEERQMVPEWAKETISDLYDPLARAAEKSQITIRAWRWYVALWL